MSSAVFFLDKHLSLCYNKQATRAPARRLAPLGGNIIRIFPTKGVSAMDELNELLVKLTELFDKLLEIMDRVEYIALKLTKK